MSAKRPKVHQIPIFSDRAKFNTGALLNSSSSATNMLQLKDKVKKSGSNEKHSYKRLKVAGGRPAMAKKVTADLDSDDELIVSMKNAKFKEKEIAQRMQDEGRVKYNSKTIGTRYARICRKLEEKNDADLDADLTDWHDGDV